MPICKACKVEKPEFEFPKNKARKSGLDALCKECTKAKNAASYEKHKEKRRTYATQYRVAHLDEVSENQRRYREENKEHLAQYAREWRAAGNKANRPSDYKERQAAQARERYATDADFRARRLAATAAHKKANPNYHRAKQKEYQSTHVGELRDYHRNYQRERLASDPAFHARQLDNQTMWRVRNWHALQKARGWVRYVPGERIALADFRSLRGWQQDHCYFCNTFIGRGGAKATIDHILSRANEGPDLTQNLVLTCAGCNFSRQERIYHVEWNPRDGVAPIEGKSFLTPKMVGKKLTEAGIDWSADGDGNLILRSAKGVERPLFIVSTFFSSDRNPAAQNGAICRILQRTHDDPIILLDREWYPRPEACLNMLRSKMGISDRGPGARKLDVVEVPQAEANTFLDAHHVMGRKGNVAIRLV